MIKVVSKVSDNIFTRGSTYWIKRFMLNGYHTNGVYASPDTESWICNIMDEELNERFALNVTDNTISPGTDVRCCASCRWVGCHYYGRIFHSCENYIPALLGRFTRK